MELPPHPLPLVVDLDGTLIANDVLLETASRFISQHPLRGANVVRWLSAGKVTLKRELWSAAPVRVDRLQYHPELLAWLNQERATGRTMVLATAADERAAQAVADHLGIFDIVLGSHGDTNLRAAQKADALVARFGEQGFEYVGNHRDDLLVWRHASVAHVVGDGALSGQAQAAAAGGRTFAPKQGSARQLVKALRPHQWVKNALIFIPLLAAHQVADVGSLLAAVLAFVAFSIAASSVYLLNDIADVENDRDHPTKRFRPFAAGTVSLAVGWALWPVLALGALVLAFGVSPLLGLVVSVYLVITAAYSFALKRKPVVDVLTLAMLYTIRIVAGAAAIDVELSEWMLSFSVFFFLSLALVKRVSELHRTRLSNTTTLGRGYRPDDLELLSSYGVTTSVTSALVFTLFVNDPGTARLYESPEMLWASIPVILAWLMRVWLLAHRGEMNEDPILFAIRDRVSVVCGLLIVVIFVLATFVTV